MSDMHSIRSEAVHPFAARDFVISVRTRFFSVADSLGDAAAAAAETTSARSNALIGSTRAIPCRRTLSPNPTVAPPTSARARAAFDRNLFCVQDAADRRRAGTNVQLRRDRPHFSRKRKRVARRLGSR